MIKNVGEQTRSQFKKGLNTHKNFFYQDEGNTPACLNIVYNHDDSISKRYGSSSMNSVALESTAGYGMYDFGALSNTGGNDGNTKLLLHMNGADSSTTFSDSSTRGYVVAVFSGAQISIAQSKFGGASGLLTASGSYLTVPDNDDWNYGTSDFTIDFWVRFNDLPTNTNNYSFYSQKIDGNNDFNINLYNDAGTYKWTFSETTSSANVILIRQVATLSTANWYHIAAVRSSNIFSFYQNGSSLGASANTSLLLNYTSDVYIGVFNDGLSSKFNGWLDEFRISKGIARYVVNFTSPTTEYKSNILQDRRLLCAAGTGIYYSVDVGRTWALAQTNRTATTNYFGFVKDYVINTNENYDVPQYWTGTMGTYFANINTAAPMCKHSLSNQGFLILLNESANKSGFYYVDQNSMFNSPFNSFKLPTDRNDELTGGFGLRNNLYISSKYKIFRLIYIGGNPDWYYSEVRNWGFVPKTIKKISIANQGEVLIGLDWSKRLRLFIGTEDEIISDEIDDNNGFTPFYLDNINSIDLNKCWAENDGKAQVYRLFLVYAGSDTVSHSLCFNYREASFYPEDNRPYNSGVLASDTADNLFMMGCNYNGRVVVMDSGNTEAGVPINDYFITPLYFQKSPTRVHKAQQIDLFFSVSSSGSIYLENRTNFSNVFNLMKEMTLVSGISSIQIRQTVDIPETVNTCQFKLSSSANTAEPWQLNLIDYSNSELGLGRG